MAGDDLPPVLRCSWERYSPDTIGAVSTESRLADHRADEHHEIEVERDAARQALADIQDAVDERSKYWAIDEVVVDVESYIEADIYCMAAYQAELDSTLTPRVIVVPGEDTIEPVIPARRRVEEHLSSDGTDPQEDNDE